MHLYLVRHGQSFMNVPEWIEENGYDNAGLTPKGNQQAAALGKWMPEKLLPSIDALYASTMLRTRETAAYLADAYNKDILFDHRLREIGSSRSDHSPWDDKDLPSHWPDYWYSEQPFSPVAPQAESCESMMHFRTRVGMFIEEIKQRHQHEHVVIVCHGGVVEAFFAHIFNIGPWQSCEVWDQNTAVSYFQYLPDSVRERWRLHFHGRIEHLQDLEDSYNDNVLY
jgi:broad specificity phosphatase PhoE